MNQSHPHLTRRYLTWCYKTTKENLDRIDRYFTQDTVDQFLLQSLKEDPQAKGISSAIDAFAQYMDAKFKKAREGDLVYKI